MTEISNLLDNEELATLRKDQEDPWVMYLIVRQSLNMSPGKIAAQVAHGATIIYEHYLKLDLDDIRNDEFVYNFREWANHSFRKIVKVADDATWQKLKEKIDCFVVRDAGLTEVEPRSETVIALSPIRKSNCPNIVKYLKLL